MSVAPPIPAAPRPVKGRPYCPTNVFRIPYERQSKNDIWSLGCLLYELLTGEVLFFAKNWTDFFYRVTNAQSPILTLAQRERLRDLPLFLKFLEFTLKRDVKLRPNILQVEHYFNSLLAVFDYPLWREVTHSTLPLVPSGLGRRPLDPVLLLSDFEDVKSRVALSFLESWDDQVARMCPKSCFKLAKYGKLGSLGDEFAKMRTLLADAQNLEQIRWNTDFGEVFPCLAQLICWIRWNLDESPLLDLIRVGLLLESQIAPSKLESFFLRIALLTGFLVRKHAGPLRCRRSFYGTNR